MTVFVCAVLTDFMYAYLQLCIVSDKADAAGPVTFRATTVDLPRRDSLPGCTPNPFTLLPFTTLMPSTDPNINCYPTVVVRAAPSAVRLIVTVAANSETANIGETCQDK